MLKLIVLICVSVAHAEIITNSNLDDFILNEILRNTRSQLNAFDQQWPDAVPNDIIIDRSHFKKIQGRKKVPMTPFRVMQFKERMNELRNVDKRNNINNNIQRFNLCHFKICNVPMGKRKTRFLHYWDMSASDSVQ